MRTILFNDLTPDLRLVVNARSEPDAAEWQSMVDDLAKTPLVPANRVIVVSDGGTPTMKQRKALDAALLARGAKTRTALVTDSSVLRAVMAAVGWVTKLEVRPFSPADLAEGFRYLNMTQAEIDLVQKALPVMCRALDVKLFERVGQKAAS